MPITNNKFSTYKSTKQQIFNSVIVTTFHSLSFLYSNTKHISQYTYKLLPGNQVFYTQALVSLTWLARGPQKLVGQPWTAPH